MVDTDNVKKRWRMGEVWEIRYVRPSNAVATTKESIMLEENWEPFAVWGNGIIALRRRILRDRH